MVDARRDLKTIGGPPRVQLNGCWDTYVFVTVYPSLVHPPGETDRALGRRVGSTQQRLEIASYGSKRQVRTHPIPNGLLAEREALAAARNQRTLTQDFCGDPPPGYSALHGKTGQR